MSKIVENGRLVAIKPDDPAICQPPVDANYGFLTKPSNKLRGIIPSKLKGKKWAEHVKRERKKFKGEE